MFRVFAVVAVLAAFAGKAVVKTHSESDVVRWTTHVALRVVGKQAVQSHDRCGRVAIVKDGSCPHGSRG